MNKLIVLNKPAETILGYATCEKLNVVKRVFSMPIQIDSDIEKTFPKIFTGLEKLPGHHKITADKSVTPVVQAPRTLSFARQEKIREELKSIKKTEK